MTLRRDDVEVGNSWNTSLAPNKSKVYLFFTARNLTDLEGTLTFRHAVPRGTRVVGLQCEGEARTTSRRGIRWTTSMGAQQTLTLRVELELDIYVDDDGQPIPRLEAPKRVLDTILIGEFRFVSDSRVWSFADGGQSRTAQLLVSG